MNVHRQLLFSLVVIRQYIDIRPHACLNLVLIYSLNGTAKVHTGQSHELHAKTMEEAHCLHHGRSIEYRQQFM